MQELVRRLQGHDLYNISLLGFYALPRRVPRYLPQPFPLPF